MLLKERTFMKLKRLIAFLLCLSLVFTLFMTSCASKQDSEVDEEPRRHSSKSDKENEEEKEPEINPLILQFMEAVASINGLTEEESAKLDYSLCIQPLRSSNAFINASQQQKVFSLGL